MFIVRGQKKQSKATNMFYNLKYNLISSQKLYFHGFQKPEYTSIFFVIMHPPRGPKGRGVAPIGATRGVH